MVTPSRLIIQPIYSRPQHRQCSQGITLPQIVRLGCKAVSFRHFIQSGVTGSLSRPCDLAFPTNQISRFRLGIANGRGKKSFSFCVFLIFCETSKVVAICFTLHEGNAYFSASRSGLRKASDESNGHIVTIQICIYLYKHIWWKCKIVQLTLSYARTVGQCWTICKKRLHGQSPGFKLAAGDIGQC